jgi:tetratricopeptide (TPR) repeat protein
LAILLAEQGKVTDAVQVFRNILQLSPDFADARFSLARALEAQQLWLEAEAEYREVLRTDPQFLAARNGLAVVLAQRGQLRPAMTELEEVLRIDAKNAAAHHNLGLMLMRQGEPTQAVAHLRQALAIRDDPEIRSTLGVALASTGKLEEAIAEHRAAVAKKPDDANLHYNLADTLERDADDVGALASYRRAWELAPDRPLMANAMAWLLATSRNAQVRRPADALPLARKACEATKHAVPEMLDTLAAAYAATGSMEQATATATQAMTLARSLNNPALAQEIEMRLNLYKKGEAFVKP